MRSTSHPSGGCVGEIFKGILMYHAAHGMTLVAPGTPFCQPDAAHTTDTSRTFAVRGGSGMMWTARRSAM